MRFIVLVGVAVLLLTSVTLSEPQVQAQVRSDELTETEVRRIVQHSAQALVPADDSNRYLNNPAAIEFGRALFFTRQLSAGRAVSCATCHEPTKAWQDGLNHTFARRQVVRNTPTVVNACFSRWQFWDGRADTLWAQALHPFESAEEFSSSRAQVLRSIEQSDDLASCYRSAFGEIPRAAIDSSAFHGSDHQMELNRAFANIGKALAAFQCSLTSLNSPVDVFVEGVRTRDPQKVAALPAEAQRGMRIFVGKGECRTCHSGPLFSNQEFHDIGVDSNAALRDGGGRYDGLRELAKGLFRASGPLSDAPKGNMARKVELLSAPSQQNRRQFKTPNLRNVELTAPYMHDGSIGTLEAVVGHYRSFSAQKDEHGETALARVDLIDSEARDLVSFLKHLTDASGLKNFQGIDRGPGGCK